MLGTQMIQTADAELVIAGGMENMSRSPYLLDRAREGYRLGHGKSVDSMIHDGLWDTYGDKHMGDCAELCSKERKISRADQDRYATLSYRRTLDSIATGRFRDEIVGIEVTAGKEKKLFDTDEEPARAKQPRISDIRTEEGELEFTGEASR
jgi:acetyl-CoA C-acetyltransferase